MAIYTPCTMGLQEAAIHSCLIVDADVIQFSIGYYIIIFIVNQILELNLIFSNLHL